MGRAGRLCYSPFPVDDETLEAGDSRQDVYRLNARGMFIMCRRRLRVRFGGGKGSWNL